MPGQTIIKPQTDTREAQETIRVSARRPAGGLRSLQPDGPEGTVVTRFRRVATLFAEKLAVAADGRSLTYRELDMLSDRVANALIRVRGAKSEPVIIMLGHSPDMLVAMLGILKAGKFHVPVDPSHPAERIKFVAEDTQAAVVVTDPAHAGLARSVVPASAVLVDVAEAQASGGGSAPDITLLPGNFAYMVYTSGSTGRPKGVIEDHRDVLGFVRQFQWLQDSSPLDRISLVHSFTFSGSMGQLHEALLTGASLHLFDLHQYGAHRLPEWLDSEGVTRLITLPTVFREAFRSGVPGSQHPSVRMVRLGGDSASAEDLELFKAHFSDRCVLVHAFGASEVKMVSGYLFTKDSAFRGDRLPLGYEVPEVEALILRTDGNEAGPGELGELVLRGPYVCPGYWRRPELTAQRFYGGEIGTPGRSYRTGDMAYKDENGCLFYVGRKDFQAKVRGHLVALQEVEAALAKLPGVSECAVTARDTGDGDRFLVAYVVPAARAEVSTSVLRKRLANNLPPYMVPAAWVLLDRLPRTPVGKLDRNALPAPHTRALQVETPQDAPRTGVEQAIAETWEEVLQSGTVGLTDEFLDLGGDSLKASRLMARLEAKFQVKVPFLEFFNAATVQQQAALVEKLRQVAGA